MLSRRIFSNTTAAIADQFIGKIGTTLAFVVLVRILPSGDIATLGIATSYMVVIAYLDVGLIRILLRDYARMAGSRELRDRHITAYFAFWALQMAAIVTVTALMQWLVLDTLHIPGLALLFWALTADFMAATQSPTNAGSAIRQAPKRPSRTRSDGQPTFRLISS